MFTRDSPFFADTQKEIFNNITNEILVLPDCISEPAKDLIRKLMERDPIRRLGFIKREGIRENPWFQDIGNYITFALVLNIHGINVFQIGKGFMKNVSKCQ